MTSPTIGSWTDRLRAGTRIARAVFAAVFLIAAGMVSVAHSVPVSNNVPLDHWSYGALDKLAGFGLLRSDLHGIRPYTRMEVARLVHEALAVREEKSLKLPPLIEHFLERFQREFREELTVYGRGDSDGAAVVTIKPIEEAQARYAFVDGKPRDFVNFGKRNGQYPWSPSGIVASEKTPLLYGNEGIVYGEGSNFSLQLSSSVKLWDLFSGYVEPILIVRQNEDPGRSLDGLSGGREHGSLGAFDQVGFDLHKGYVKFSPWNVEIEFGRDSMWWGQGYNGSLIMSNNAGPLDMLKITNPTNTLLPWVFRYLGPFKYTVFVARPDDYLNPVNPLLSGGSVSFKPLPWLELGFETAFLMNGEDRPSTSFSNYLKALFGFGFGQPNEIDQVGSFEARLRLPFLWNAELYLEYGGEDSGGEEYVEEWFGFGDVGYLTGIYFPRITPDGKTDLRFEFARTAHRVDSTPGFWYGHTSYRWGYTNDQMIVGHRIGPDAIDYFARVTRYLRNDLRVGVDFEHMVRGVSLNVVEEESNGFGADVTWDIDARWSVAARYAFQDISNFNLVRGVDQANHLLVTGVKFSF